MSCRFLFCLCTLFLGTTLYSQSKLDKFWLKSKMDSVKVEKLIKEIDVNKDSDFFNWEDVTTSMRRNYQRVERLNEKCGSCHHYLYSIWFVSPDWTWEQMCGTAGDMTICPYCSKQIEYQAAFRN